MRKELIILAVVVCAVLADNYWCPQSGEAFECFESDPNAKFCLNSGKTSVVICSKCRKKYEFCRNGLKVSKRPEYDCGAGWESTPCTGDNSAVPAVF
ncbi:unnamed protein product [Lymnaea stagnalis]|uniref:Uncharacterized protein n=1 Tax=Lymnaea stagnalis TaxID=6523 RepID=A0AAV2H5D4_LYMST